MVTVTAKPRAAVRRFDVFAEYNRLKAQKEDKLRVTKAKGYGLWLAKVVAARKFGRLPEPKQKGEKKEGRKEPKVNKQGWHELSGVAQTAALFDKEIVGRMGTTFYRRVFSPAVRKALESGKSYVDIRDTIRANWKP
jgi:hypothetical protein